jgi:hypothetical protein
MQQRLRRGGTYGASMTHAPAIDVDATLADLASTLEACPPLGEDPARATSLAAALLAPTQERDAPRELAASLPGVVERLGADRAPALLARMAEFGRRPAAEAARSAIDRLGAARPAPLRVTEAWRVADEEAEAFAFDMRRGVLDQVEARVFVLLDRRLDAGRLGVGCAGPPEDEPLASLLPDLFDAEPQLVVPGEAAVAIRAAWKRTEAAGEAVPAALAVALTLLERTLLGDQEELPALGVDPSDVLYGEPDESLAVEVLENEAHAHATVDRLLDEFDEHAERLFHDVDLPLGFVADSMLSYKVNYADGLLGHWPASELEVFLLEWWPGKVIAGRETERAAPAAILAFLCFLDARDSLSGGSLDELADTLDALSVPFLEECEDVTRWGVAKSLLDSGEFEDGGRPAARGPASQVDRRKRRKAARVARKRNRR